MARKPLTLEEIETKIANDLIIIKAQRNQYEKLGKAIVSTSNRLKRLQEQKAAFVPMTLEQALTTYLETGENSLGHKWLEEKSWKGDWKDTGLRYNGSYWSETNQYVMTVWSNFAWGAEELKRQEETIMSVLPAVKPGTVKAGTMLKLGKGDEVDVNLLKVFNIFEQSCSAYNDWLLANTPDGRWVIYDGSRARYSWCEVPIVGTLTECLEYIRTRLYYEGPRREEDEED